MCSLEADEMLFSAYLAAVVVLVTTIGWTGLGAATGVRAADAHFHFGHDVNGNAGRVVATAQLDFPATEATLPYCSPGGDALEMDFYVLTFRGAVPVVLQVHGGGWVSVTAPLTSPPDSSRPS